MCFIIHSNNDIHRCPMMTPLEYSPSISFSLCWLSVSRAHAFYTKVTLQCLFWNVVWNDRCSECYWLVERTGCVLEDGYFPVYLHVPPSAGFPGPEFCARSENLHVLGFFCWILVAIVRFKCNVVNSHEFTDKPLYDIWFRLELIRIKEANSRLALNATS